MRSKNKVYWNDHDHDWVDTYGGIKQMCRVCGELQMKAKTYVRRGAHATEIEAAHNAQYRAGTDKARLLDLLERLGPSTCDELSVEMVDYGRPDRPNQFASRIKNLVEDGHVEDSGIVRKTRTGTSAIVWQVKP